jgi:hypothetical protein
MGPGDFLSFWKTFFYALFTLSAAFANGRVLHRSAAYHP